MKLIPLILPPSPANVDARSRHQQLLRRSGGSCFLCPVARDRGPHRGCACALSQFTALVDCEAVSINVTEGWGAAGAHDASCLWALWGGDDTLEILEHFHDSDYALLHVLVRVCRTWSSCETGHTIPVLLCACTYLRVARIAPPPN